MPQPRRQPAPQDVAAMYEAAQLQIAALVLTALATGRLDAARFRRVQATEAAAVLARVNALAIPVASEQARSSYRDGVGLVDQSLLGQILGATIDTLIQNLAGRLEQLVDIVGRQVQDILRREGLRAAAQQAVRELPVGFAAGQLRRDLMQKGVTGFVDKAGRRWQLSTYSRMVIETTTSEARTQGVVDAMKARGRDLIRIAGPERGRCEHHPKNPEHPCVRLDGKVLSLSGRAGYERADDLPPFHPRCRHVALPAPEPKPLLEVV